MLASESVSLNILSQSIPKHFFAFSHLASVLLCKFFQQFVSVRSSRLILESHLQDYLLTLPHIRKTIYSPLPLERGWE